MKNQELIPTQVTYIHPVSRKTLTDKVLNIDYNLEKVVVDRAAPNSTASMILSFFEVESFQYLT